MLFFYIYTLKYLVKGGHIYSLDADLEFQNSGYAEYLKIPFSLESGIIFFIKVGMIKKNYLEIRLPS